MLILKAYPLFFCFSNAPTKWVVCAECCFCPSSWHHLLILKTPPHQQMVSLRRTETTNCAVTEHNPQQQMCWSTKWVGRPDCCFWHPFTFLVTPTSTKWATGPIWSTSWLCCLGACTYDPYTNTHPIIRVTVKKCHPVFTQIWHLYVWPIYQHSHHHKSNCQKASPTTPRFGTCMYDSYTSTHRP